MFLVPKVNGGLSVPPPPVRRVSQGEGVAWIARVRAAHCHPVPAAELMERAAVPPLWPALYSPGRSPLHHAQQLQLFSQQHFLRQQEFLYLQQQAAQALELQRSAQLVVSPEADLQSLHTVADGGPGEDQRGTESGRASCRRWHLNRDRGNGMCKGPAVDGAQQG